jgi:peptidoglycan hydrolase CwlO-like protein
MLTPKVKIAQSELESETAWADQYFRQWQEVTKELGEARKQLQAREKEIEILQAEIRRRVDSVLRD